MSMFPIATSGTLTTTTTNIIFTNIPQTFNHLQVRVYVKSAYAAGEAGVYLNPYIGGSGGGTAQYHVLAGNGSSVSETNGTIFFTGINSPINFGTTNMFAAAVIDILDYSTTTKYKSIRSFGGYDSNGAGIVALGEVTRNDSLGAINGMIINDAGGGGWLAGSRIDLYGISTSNATGA